MRALKLALSVIAVFACGASQASAEVFVRWDQRPLPGRAALGISTLVIPAANAELVKDARRAGYRIVLEVDAKQLAAVTSFDGLAAVVVKGQVTPTERQTVEKRLAARAVRVLTLDERGKWPHIRTNWVTKNRDVLQTTSRSSQPWLENNAALARIDRPLGDDVVLSYAWTPITASDRDTGPALENYLVAISEAASFGNSLVLPLFPRFQRDLASGLPQARADWAEMRRHLDFAAWNVAGSGRPIANIAVLTADPFRSFEVLNLLLRHNLPFETFAPDKLPDLTGGRFDAVLALDPPAESARAALERFVEAGGKSVNVPPAALADPNEFALQIRKLLGPDRRRIDIWNGITVLATPFDDEATDATVLTLLNYAAQPLPVQLRIRGRFVEATYESPDEPAALVPVEERNGFTELTIPALRTAGRVFLKP